MSSYVKPQVLVFQEFKIIPTEITEPLRAHIAGPHALLHRYNNKDEKPYVRLGAYDRLNDTFYPWPQRKPGSTIDNPYTKLYIDKALLQYYSTESDATEYGDAETPESAAVYSPDNVQMNNVIRSDMLAFKSNGSAYPRSNVFKDRDVQLGDVVHLRHVDDNEACTVTHLYTSVVGFSSDNVDSLIEPAVSDEDNQVTIASGAVTVTNGGAASTDTAYAAVGVTASGPYEGLISGQASEEYTVTVVHSSVAGCSAARFRVVSASGTDDHDEVAIDADDDVTVGVRGAKLNFATPAAITFGQVFLVAASQTFVATVATAGGAGGATADEAGVVAGNGVTSGYTGEKNDVYVIECVKGGKLDGTSQDDGADAAGFPQVNVYTVKGLDHAAGIEITSLSAYYAIGSAGVTVRLSASTQGLRKGDKWYIPVVSSRAGQVHELRLRDDVPVQMRGLSQESQLTLELYIKDDIEISKNRIGFAPETNYYTEDTQVCVQEGIVAYHPEWTDAGVPQPLNVYDGEVHVEYREWLSALVDDVGSISDVADLDQIAGQLDPDNPLKWGVYKALSNSNGTVVKYTAVQEPDLFDADGKRTGSNLDSWVQVLERIKGRDDMYNLIPLTFDRMVFNLWAAHIGAESNEYANNWKAGFFALQSRPVARIVGEGVDIGGVLGETVTEPVLATLSDDPAASNTQYTKLQVTTGNGYFISNNVQPGDVVRYNYTIDDLGEEKYDEFVVDRVLSESTILLYAGGDIAVTQPQRVEVHHHRSRNEVAADVAHQGASLSNRRICGVWPDQVGEAGTVQPGFFLACALAGLASGVVPHQGLTHVEVAGFDDYTRSYKYFNETQLNVLAESGVWIVTEDKDGTPFTRHGVTTDNLDLNRREEMIRRNVDSMSYLFLRRLQPFIGRTNAHVGMVQRLRFEVTSIIDFLKTNGFTAELGSQLIDGTIRVLQIHPLLKDRIEIVLDLTVPAPLNNIELHLVV